MKMTKGKLVFTTFIFEILMIINFLMNDNTVEYAQEYIVLLVTNLLVMLVYIGAFKNDNYDVFHPLSIVTILYLCIFIFCPIYLITINDTLCHGAYVMDGCIKGTLVFLIGYIAMVYGYNNTKIKDKLDIKIQQLSNNHISKIVLVSIIIWGVSWLIYAFVMIKSGKSLSYLISLGIKGSNNSTFNSFGDDGGILFLAKFSNAMVIPWLIICFYQKNKLLKIFTTIITLSAFYITGFRYMIVLMVMAWIVCYYRIFNKKIKKSTIFVLGVLLILFVTILGYARATMRIGEKVDWSDLTSDSITYTLVNNFNIYQPYYGLVKKYPSEHMYTLGHSIFYESAIYFIPRAIWNSKPVAKKSSAVALAEMNSTNEYTVQTVGMAWPNIAEYYMEFGIMGVTVFMFLFGKLMKKSVSLYNSSNIFDIFSYSILIGVFFQLVIRGYTPSNLGTIAFLFLPIPIIKLSIKKKEIINNESKS